MEEDTIHMKKEVLRDIAQRVLEHAQIPRKQHLKIVQALSNTMREHGGDRESWRKTLLSFAQHLEQHTSDREKHLQDYEALKGEARTIFEGHATELERMRGTIVGEPGERGLPGKDADEDLIISAILSKIELPPGRKGDPGEPGKAAEFDEEKLFTKFVELLQKNKLLDATHVKGLQGFIKDGVKYRFEELMHGGGSSTGGTTTIYTETPTGLINGANTVYTTVHVTNTIIGIWINGEFIHPGEYTKGANGFTMGTAIPANLAATGFTISYS